MRLSEVYFTAKSALASLPAPNYSQKNTNSGIYYTVTNWERIANSLDEIGKIPGLESHVEKVYSVLSSQIASLGSVNLTNTEKSNLEFYLSHIKTALSAIVNMYGSFHIEPETSGFDVRFPDGMSLEDLSIYAGNLDKAFKQCPVLNQDGDSIKLVATDVGSFWLSFAVISTATSLLLSRIVALVDKCMIVRSHMIQCRQLEEQARALAIGNDCIESMVEQHKKLLSAVVDTVAQDLCANNEITDNEKIERTKLSISIISDLMSQGLQIYASVQSPAEIKALFPPVEQQKLTDTDIKMLTESLATKPKPND